MFYDYYNTHLIGTLTLAGDDQGLRHIAFETAHKPVQILNGWTHDAAFFKNAKEQLRAYFNGELEQFDLRLAPAGTPFQQSVWRALRKIPYGAVVSYRWVAEQIDRPKAVRAVGGANAHNPLPIVIPCHRVIGSDGELTGFGGGLAVKQRLLELEKSRRGPAQG
jgi:methylated-DNA-[protein]-cysteine S-methyltransferase